MKKIFYIALLALFSFFMVACDETEYSFSIVVDNVSELRESIVLDLTLVDEHDELKDSEIKATISKKDASTVLKTKTLTFGSDNKEELEFTGLEADKDYTIVVYAGYEGSKVTLHQENYKTTDEGTKENPYIIKSYTDFTNKVKKDSDGYFKISDEVEYIDFDGKSISPLFTSSTPFVGHFDGNGKTIKNFKLADKNEDGSNKNVTSSSQYHGLFGYIEEGATITNVTLENFNVYVSRSTSLSSSKASYYGILAGYSAGTIEKVTVVNSTLNVASTSKTKEVLYVGGLVGNLSKKGTLNEVSVAANISVSGVYDAVVGGVCATTSNAARITKTENDSIVNVANISKTSFNGAIDVNLLGSTTSVPTSVGAILGKNYSALVDDCAAEGTITLKTSFTNVNSLTINVGGLVGWMVSDNSVLSNSVSKVTFSVESLNVPTADDAKVTINAGLLVGRNGTTDSKSTISACEYQVGTVLNVINVTGSDKVVVRGGLVAYTASQYNDCNVDAATSITVNEYKAAVDGEDATIETTYNININVAE